MAIEKYIAAASLGLFVMFVGEIITIYDYMSEEPESRALQIEPNPKIFQYISIGVAPAAILAGISFTLSKGYGSKPVGTLIIAGGAILLVGMYYANLLVSNIESVYLTDSVLFTPPLFMAVSIPVMVVGGLLFRIKKRKKKKDFV
ncbi:MAG: hypothetical protein IIA81_05795 [Thaumarchaeota archaeon]|nr:hypothetical protein [Nitrososphaerota archaeon]